MIEDLRDRKFLSYEMIEWLEKIPLIVFGLFALSAFIGLAVMILSLVLAGGALPADQDPLGMYGFIACTVGMVGMLIMFLLDVFVWEWS